MKRKVEGRTRGRKEGEDKKMRGSKRERGGKKKEGEWMSKVGGGGGEGGAGKRDETK